MIGILIAATQQTFPNVVVADPFGFRPANLLETEALHKRQKTGRGLLTPAST